jgi:hypothetical protein
MPCLLQVVLLSACILRGGQGIRQKTNRVKVSVEAWAAGVRRDDPIMVRVRGCVRVRVRVRVRVTHPGAFITK